jgi:hypothetical protein
LGLALGNLGARIDGLEGLKKLEEAVKAFTSALTIYTEQSLPFEWAVTQNNLAGALLELGRRIDGVDGQKKLEDAVQAYRCSLRVGLKSPCLKNGL